MYDFQLNQKNVRYYSVYFREHVELLKQAQNYTALMVFFFENWEGGAKTGHRCVL